MDIKKTLVKLAVTALALAAGTSAALGYEQQDSPILFYHAAFGTPALDTLLAEYDYDEYVQNGTTEFEKMCLLNDWVFYNLYFEASYDAALRNALQILRLTAEGKAFYCTNFAAVYASLAASLGWTARYLGMNGHTTNDIWSNQYRKWVFMDNTWNVHYEKDGIPLSVPELRDEFNRNQGRDLTLVFGVGAHERRWTVADYPLGLTCNYVNSQKAWSLLGRTAFVFNNAWRWWPLPNSYIGTRHDDALVSRKNCLLEDAGDVWTGYHMNATDNAKLFHDLNRVDITKAAMGPDQVAITLDAFGPNNYTPNFKEFQVQIDDGPWETSPASFTWTRHAGLNELKARIVNRFGVTGPVSQVSYGVTGINPLIAAPREWELRYANPSAKGLRVTLLLRKPCTVTTGVYDLAGGLVKELVNGPKSAGTHAVTWNFGDTLCQGVYLLEATVGNRSFTDKLILIP